MEGRVAGDELERETLIGSGKHFCFYSEREGQLLESSEQR